MSARRAAERVLGYDPETLMWAPAGRAVPYPRHDQVCRRPGALRKCPGLVVGPVQARMRHRDGGWRWLEISLSNRVTDPDVAGIVANVHDITSVKTAEADLAHNATHDTLTDLPNRPLLVDRLDVPTNRPKGGPWPSCFVTSTGFKVLNDSRGHGVGRRGADRGGPTAPRGDPPQDTVARFGGDESVVCCEGLDNTRRRRFRIAAACSEAREPAFPPMVARSSSPPASVSEP